LTGNTNDPIDFAGISMTYDIDQLS
jgi:hypothetical protein